MSVQQVSKLNCSRLRKMPNIPVLSQLLNELQLEFLKFLASFVKLNKLVC